MSLQRLLLTGTPIAIIALAGMGLATAQSSSPFASKKRAQAWEQQPAAPQAAPSYSAPAYAAPAYSAPPQQPPVYQAPSVPTAFVPSSTDAPIATRPRRSTALPSYSASTPPKTFAGRAPTARPISPQPQAQPQPKYQAQPQYNDQMLAGSPTPPSGYVPTRPPARSVAQAPDFGSPIPPQSAPPSYAHSKSGVATSGVARSSSPFAPRPTQPRQGWNSQPSPTPPPAAYQAQAPQNQGYQPRPLQPAYTRNAYTPQGYIPGYQSSTPPTGRPPTGAPYPGGPYTPPPQQPRSWTERLGLNNLATVIKGKLNLGGAGTYREQPPNQVGPQDGWSEDFIADAEIEGEVSAITDNGLEYGVVLGARAQYDRYRRGFGGRLPDCPAGTIGCSGTTAGLRGHTSGFYSVGEDIAQDAQFAIESAHLFLRSAYGDVTLGRDDGAAYLFSLGAPTLLAVGASNSPIDYTGYDSVKTVNDASGFAEKITYTSPRLLGDQIGFGVQLGLSYAPDADVCGVDYCNGENIDGVLQPEIEDVLEVGLALDRTFENGLSVELTGTYARGSEGSALAGLDDLESFGAGLEFEYGDWTLGGSFLQSNNGLLDGDYTAYDAGLTWKPGALGFTLGYGYAEDDNVGLTANQGTFGVTYDFEKFTLGTGVQYVDRDVQGLVAGAPTTLDQRATSVFVQGGFKF